LCRDIQLRNWVEIRANMSQLRTLEESRERDGFGITIKFVARYFLANFRLHQQAIVYVHANTHRQMKGR